MWSVDNILGFNFSQEISGHRLQKNIRGNCFLNEKAIFFEKFSFFFKFQDDH